jgi:hypothetical protein
MHAEQMLREQAPVAELRKAWSSAKACSAFGSEIDRAYDNAFVRTLGPHIVWCKSLGVTPHPGP